MTAEKVIDVLVDVVRIRGVPFLDYLSAAGRYEFRVNRSSFLHYEQRLRPRRARTRRLVTESCQVAKIVQEFLHCCNEFGMLGNNRSHRACRHGNDGERHRTIHQRRQERAGEAQEQQLVG